MQCLMSHVDLYSYVFISQNHYLLDLHVKCVSYNYDNFSFIFLCSATCKPRLLKIHQIIFCLL